MLTNVKSLKGVKQDLRKKEILLIDYTAKPKLNWPGKVLYLVFHQNIYFSALKQSNLWRKWSK